MTDSVEIVRRGYEALATQDALGDWNWFFEEFAHDDLELRPAGTYLDADQIYRGRDGWARFWRDFSAAWEEWHYDPDAFEFFDAGEEVVVFARAVGTGKGSGLEVTQDEAHIWTVKDGKLLRGVTYMDRGEALKDAGLSR